MLIKPKIARIYAPDYNNQKVNPKSLKCSWNDLKGKKILNENIFICDFPDVHPYEFPPIFPNAKNVFLEHNYKYFTYYWLNRRIFPNNPTIYLNGHPCDTPVVTRGFLMYVTSPNYFRAKRYAGEANLERGIIKENTLINEITLDDYENLLDTYEIEPVEIIEEDMQVDVAHKELTQEDVEKNNGIISATIMKNVNW